jgi:hypothetical protein
MYVIPPQDNFHGNLNTYISNNRSRTSTSARTHELLKFVTNMKDETNIEQKILEESQCEAARVWFIINRQYNSNMKHTAVYGHHMM